MNSTLTLSELKFFFLRFIAIFFLLVAVFGTILHYDMSSSEDTMKSNIRVQQQALLEGKKEYIEWVMGSVVRETALLADLMAAKQIFNLVDLEPATRRSTELSRLSSVLEIVSQRKEVYDQLRYLDMEGNEVVRINFNEGHAQIVPEEQLQNKSHRYYFAKAMQLGCRKIYVSPLDLNMEHGQIEAPLKPMIRLAAPVFDKEGNKRGIVVVNYLAKYLMDGMQLFSLDASSNYMLLNKDGYFLFNKDHPDSEFAFMYEGGEKDTIYNAFPDIAEQIRETRSGRIENDQGIMTIESVGAVGRINPYCFQDYHVSENSSTAWKLASYVNFDTRKELSGAMYERKWLMQVGILLSIVLAYFIARFQLRAFSDNQRIHYLAHHDSLTGLVNRAAFQTQALETLLQSAKAEKKACLMYLDLDSFKLVNDQYGHAAGDKTLSHVASVLHRVFGDNALLARLGGDEFAILLSSSEHMENPEHYAASLIQLIQDPIEVMPNSFYQVTTSIGACCVATHHCTLDELMHKADMAMYEAKKSGKNRYFFLQ
ncbi:GGDEF domain-containing protein [Vibrio hyugaensis]|uniref:GGDEF domain-containing protein n=1 Tax=Vibrio hyugaensis TaxID=1534743 RepID=A0ABQ5Y4H6_9VIBR|nr:sensor domain-containing diguanylate cyclase [Vibrio hyugaensis]GLR05815.1 GGDEF domain-containing protein [Vibrio hyugaensis]